MWNVTLNLLLGFHLQVALQRFDVFPEGLHARRRDAAESARLTALESLFHFDIACCREFVYLHAQVACRGSGLFSDVRKLGFLSTDEQRDDSQAELRVKQWI